MVATAEQMQQHPQPLLFQRSGRPDASMTLLTEVMERPLDPSYAAAAARRQERQLRGSQAVTQHRGWSKPVALVSSVFLGAGIAIAATNLYVPTSGLRETRQLLETQIHNRRESINNSTEFLTNISSEIAALQTGVLVAGDPLLARQLEIDELHNGRIPLSGPGLIISLTDGGGGLTEITSDHLVRDVDLQQVVSALWASGAEAIAIANQRLTLTTAIRNAGDAILIDLQPVLGPTYQIVALGSPAQMETAWLNSGAPTYLAMLGAEFGISATVTASSSLTVPSATPPVLRYAQPLLLLTDSDSE